MSRQIAQNMIHRRYSTQTWNEHPLQPKIADRSAVDWWVVVILWVMSECLPIYVMQGYFWLMSSTFPFGATWTLQTVASRILIGTRFHSMAYLILAIGLFVLPSTEVIYVVLPSTLRTYAQDKISSPEGYSHHRSSLLWAHGNRSGFGDRLCIRHQRRYSFTQRKNQSHAGSGSSVVQCKLSLFVSQFFVEVFIYRLVLVSYRNLMGHLRTASNERTGLPRHCWTSWSSTFRPFATYTNTKDVRVRTTEAVCRVCKQRRWSSPS